MPTTTTYLLTSSDQSPALQQVASKAAGETAATQLEDGVTAVALVTIGTPDPVTLNAAITVLESCHGMFSDDWHTVEDPEEQAVILHVAQAALVLQITDIVDIPEEA